MRKINIKTQITTDMTAKIILYDKKIPPYEMNSIIS